MTTLTPITTDLTVAAIVEQHPATVEVFARHGIDLCCGGGRTLAAVALAHRLELPSLLHELGATERRLS